MIQHIFIKVDHMDFNSVLLIIQDKLPKDGVSSAILKDKFESLSQDKQKDFISKLSQIKLKSPAFVFWVGNFLLGNLGVARFMIGDMLLGFIPLGLVILDIFIELSFNNASILLVIWIWWIVDLFLVGKKLRKQNLEKIINLTQ